MIQALYNKLKLVFDFIIFGITAKTIDDIDSPFLYQFHKQVVNSFKPIEYTSINAYIKKTKKDNQLVSVNTAGAASKVHKSKNLRIKQIARSAVSSKFKCSILIKIIEFFQSQNILELGTSLGVSTMYLSKLDCVKTITTVEGERDIYNYAKSNSISTKTAYVHSLFSDLLKDLRTKKNQYDCVIIDGDHTKKATVDNFYQATKLLTPKGIIILDDIYWSDGMKSAWNHIKNTNREFHSINLFYFGVMFKSDSLKEITHTNIFPFSIRWKMGFFR